MSVEEAVTDGLQQPANPNAQSAEDVKNMLAELKGESESQEPSKVSEKQEPSQTEETEPVKPGDKTESESKKSNGDNREDNNGDGERRHHHGGYRGGRGGRGGRGRGGSQNRSYKDNVKSDLTSLPETDDPQQIRKQVEFYFSDSNLPMDKFLLEQTGGSENKSVKVEVLHSFKRMRRFQPFAAIVNALKDSTFLEVVDDDTAVRRKIPISINPDDHEAVKVFEDLTMPRSVYVKGFGDEVPSTQFDIEAFFTQYGPTNAIRLRRNDEKIFKGSVFVEFTNEEQQQTFLALDPKPKWKGSDLKIMSKKEYCEQKVEDIKSGKIKPNRGYDRDMRNPYRSDRRHGDQKRKRNDDDDRDWRVRRDEDQKRGYRDDKGRRNHRGGDRRGGRDDRDRHSQDNRNERGIPKVKDTTDDSTRRDAAKAEALAKANAMVEAEQKKEADAAKEGVAGDTVEPPSMKQVVEDGNDMAESSKGVMNGETGASKKRSREEDDEGVEEREAKKPTVKTES